MFLFSYSEAMFLVTRLIGTLWKLWIFSLLSCFCQQNHWRISFLVVHQSTQTLFFFNCCCTSAQNGKHGPTIVCWLYWRICSSNRLAYVLSATSMLGEGLVVTANLVCPFTLTFLVHSLLERILTALQVQGMWTFPTPPHPQRVVCRS